ncbi:hypothetical protein [Shewanella sp. SR44-3]|uniref:hypothetical protein n=1 Tax=Shewanella sp. SR44-3 TaxID=2760936 RepID=UPI0015FB296C|nr:hypothetical protein [Shewanella sp. SR44-3]MBB1268590.1 hypothetical protein [Shewanella sp. SR44-3]
MMNISLTFLVVYLLLAGGAWFNASRRGSLHWCDISAPVLIPLCWVGLVMAGYGHQSLAHLIEIPILLSISVLLLNVRVFVLDHIQTNTKINAYIVLGIGLLSVLLVRHFMPFLAE